MMKKEMEEEEDLGFGDDGDFEIYNNEDMSPEDEEFDTVVGAMQEVLVSEEFEKRQNEFIKNHCMKFVETEENTHEMWMIHKKFKEEIEKYLETAICEIIPNYTQKRFMELLKGREDQLDEGIVDTLAAFDNFLEFKNQALEMKLRQLKRDEPAQYALIVEKNKGSKNIMNIVNMIESQGDLMQVDFISNNDMY